MDFVRRRLSQGGSSDEEGRSLSSSLSEGTSRFFSSMVAKKNGLLSNISNKFENVLKTASSSEDSGSGPDSPVGTPTSTKSGHSYYSNGQNLSGEYSPYHYKPNKKTERIGIIRHSSSSGYSDSSGNDEFTTGGTAGISFDEPLYSPTRKSPDLNPNMKVLQQNHKNKDLTSKDADKIKESIPKQNEEQPGSPSVQNDVSAEQPTNQNEPNQADTQGQNESKDSDQEKVKETKKPPKLKRRSSTVDEMLFDDYVPPPEEEDYNDESRDEVGTEDINFNRRKIMLPMGDLISFDDDVDDSRKLKKISPIKTHNPSISSAESPDYEGSNIHASVDSTSESEFGGYRLQRSCSFGSENSWSSSYSIDSQPDELTLECMEFMKQFVDKIFDSDCEISQMEKAKFGEMCQFIPGRLWFARYVNAQRVHNKRVSEQIFFRMVQYFAVVLFECNEADDFSPAKSLMNMCFTFFHETWHGNVQYKNFLYSYLREQPIWQSLRFWNAAFFDAVQSERSKRPMCTSDDGDETVKDDRQFQQNITFGQLGTFTCNMRAFGLSKELCLEFLRKQSTIANLRDEQIQLLKDNVDKWREH
ncbi:hypothetical protein FSP39_001918 [Pinctada imbricata]|uniref:SBF1/SBF2 domain-containing protein n=1 Tax=Pinctada imbricata TaxID=66713 RepID=A0AA89BLC0_PINIB|nr:hypothetical protein FSP39_001918 [Pinctada imbricata]